MPLGATITISADASDSHGSVSRVEFYADDKLLVYDVVAPYTFDWTDAVAGSHVITAKAFDNNGAGATSGAVTVVVEPAPNNQPPSVTITKPRDGARVFRWWGTTIEVDADDPDGNVTKVEFYSGSTLLHTDFFASYSFYWWPDSRGFHTLSAVAYDDGGAETTSDPVTVRVR